VDSIGATMRSSMSRKRADRDRVESLCGKVMGDSAAPRKVVKKSLENLVELLGSSSKYMTRESRSLHWLRLVAWKTGIAGRCLQVLDLEMDDVELVRAAVKVLRFVPRVPEKHVALFLANEMGAPSIFAKCMRHFAMDREVQVWSARTLTILCFHKENGELVTKSGIPQVLAELIEKHSRDPEVLEAFAGAVWNLAVEDWAWDDLRRLEVPLLILSNLRDNSEHAGFAENGWGALANLSLSKDNLMLMTKEFGTPQIVDLMLEGMEEHRANPDTSVQLLRAMKTFCTGSHEFLNRIVQGTGPESLVKVLNSHPRSESIAKTGLRTLRHLSTDQNSRMGLMQMGAAEVVLTAMRYHPDSAFVLHEGCNALTNLGMDPNAITALVNSDASAIVIKAMNQHLHHTSLQVQACGTLWILTSLPVARDDIFERGAADAVLCAMRLHPESPALQFLACVVLTHLASRSKFALEISQKGACKDVMHAMRKHPESVPVQRRGCITLATLIRGNETRRMSILKMGVKELLLDVQKTHKDHRDVLVEVDLLLNLLQNYESDRARPRRKFEDRHEFRQVQTMVDEQQLVLAMRHENEGEGAAFS